MAFHQPTRQPTQRAFRPTIDYDDYQDTHPPQQPAATQAADESQTWVLFAPATDAGTTTSYLTPTHHTESTPGRSQLSDLGSLNSAVRSEVTTSQQQLASAVGEDEEDDEDAELDSLDSHLPEFRSIPNLINTPHGIAHTAPVLPAHDGLGSFRLDHEGMGADAQDRLYAFEQYNPRRVKRRRESLEMAQAEMEGQQREMDKMQRIEAWRLEHSRFLLAEIQKETRRRRSAANLSNAQSRDKEVTAPPAEASLDEVDPAEAWHDQHASAMLDGNGESAWGRITRKIIRDLLGIDDHLLSILFGEALPEEDDLCATPKALSAVGKTDDDVPMEDVKDDEAWQLRALERISRELGMLVNQLSGHPGAFSTYSRVQQAPIPYAGLPPIPESLNDASRVTAAQATPVSMPEFKPTVAPPAPLTNPSTGRTASHEQNEGSNSAIFTKEEWEQDLDVRLVFRYLRSRFMSRPSSSGNVSGNPHLATSNSSDVAAKAARVRQHHPLVSRSRPAERRALRATTPSSPVHYRHTSSCASHSTRRRKSSCSSRHYWDIGAGSVGTGSLIAAAGPMGSWGEI